MCLRDILSQLVDEQQQVMLNDGIKDWDAGALLEELSAPMLKRNAHMQSGLYIAEINEKGYLGQVLYKVIPKN